MQLLRHLLVFLGNRLPRYRVMDHARSAVYRLAGVSIGTETRIAGPLILDLSLRSNTFRSITIGRRTYINYHCRISAYNSQVTIGDECLIGPNVDFETSSHCADPLAPRAHLGVERSPITIGNNVWIGANVVILPGVTIGDNSVVAAGAVVNRSVDKGVVVAGVPARVLRR